MISQKTDTYLDLLSEDTDGIEKYCRIEYFQGSGAGGQKRNKVKTAARCNLDQFELVSENADQRGRKLNVLYALRKLKIKLALYLVQDTDKETIQKYMQTSLIQNELPLLHNARSNNPKYALLVFIVFALIKICDGDMASVANKCGCSKTALFKFIKNNKLIYATYIKIQSLSH